MDTREYQKGLIVEDDDHLNEQLGPGGTVETAVDNLQVDFETDGIISGLTPTQHAGTPDMTVDVSTGVAYDGEGKRCKVSAGQVVDLSGVTLPGSGNEKYVAILIENTVSNAEAWVDDEGVSGYWEHNDSFTISLTEGAEAATGTATPPSLHATKRLICDVLLYNGMTQILNADIDTDRREESVWPADRTSVDASGWSVLDTASTTVQEALDDVDAKIIDRSAITGGYTLDSAQILTRVHPLHIATVEEDASWVYQLNTVLGGDTMDTWDIQLAGGATPAEQYLYFPLLVPDGAKWLSAGGTTWIKLDVFQDVTASTQLLAALYKKAYTDGAESAIGGATATLGSFAAWTELTLSVSSDETIDNAAYSYYVRVRAGRDTVAAIESSVRAIKWAVSVTDLGRAVGI